MTPYNIIFFGTPDIAKTCLETLINDQRFAIKLVVTQPDKPAGRGSRVSQSTVKTCALKHGIHVIQPSSIKKDLDNCLNQFSEFGPYDVGIVVAFGQILPQAVLDFPKHGCINIHASLLPRWRGAAPIQRAILSGDTTTGVCLMQMDAGLDTGAIFCEEKIDITGEDDFKSLHDKISNLAQMLLKRDLPIILEGKIKPVAQKTEGITYANKISSEETLINWSNNALQIERQIRAFSPFPGAHTIFQGKRLKIFKAKATTINNKTKEFGKVHFVDKTRLEVICLDGILSLEEVQLEGKNRLTIVDFIKGQKLDTSIQLGDTV
jgi:methionyl-tRNA formyltransferase